MGCPLEAEFSGGWLGFSPLEIFSSVSGGGDKYLEFLAYFPEFRKNKIKTFSPRKTRLHTKPARLTFFREVKPKVDYKVFHLWIFLCRLPSTVASVSDREDYCMLRLCRSPLFPSLPAPLLKHSSPTSVLSSSSSSSRLLPGLLAQVASSPQQLQQQNVDF